MIIENASLKALNSFGLDVAARYMAEVSSVDALREVLGGDHPWQNHMILGGGSNVLFTQNYDGLIIKNSIGGIEVTKEMDDEVLVKAGAGVVWHDLVMFCVDRGFGGIENLSLIPGCVGAAPMQNIGAYGVEVKDVFDQLTAFDLNEKVERAFSAEECEFGYRESVFKRKLKGQFLISSLQLRLSKKPKINTSYGAIDAELSAMNVENPSIKDVSSAVISIRSSKLPDPAVLGNAGSFFKNPILPIEKVNALKKDFPDMPTYQFLDKMKVAAGWLIEHCGWKGKRIGNCGSHAKQALVLVNYGGSTGGEIFKLSEQIQASVLEKFEIQLEREVNVV